MLNLIETLWADEAGFVVSAELVIVATTVVLGATVALVAVRDALGGEMADLAESFRSLDQSYYKAGVRGARKPNGTYTAWTAGSSFFDPHLRGDAEQQEPLPEDLELCRSHHRNPVFPPAPVILNSTVIPTVPCEPAPCQQPCLSPCQPDCLNCPPVLEQRFLPAPTVEPVPDSASSTIIPCLSCPPGTNGLLAPTPFSALPNCAAPTERHSARLSAPYAPVYNPYAPVPTGPLQVW
ncbi:MAG TPA: hypothetical protein VNQ76_10370 [Planctomicrobium sp.]|nr:hypothetical protein [Planctomicrobium sp.]